MTKPTIVTRIGKGAALTYEEQDANFTNLQNATITVTDGTNSKAIDLNGTITFTGLTVNSSTGAVSIDSANFVTLDGVQTITGNKTFTGQVTIHEYSETVTALTFSTSITPNSDNGPILKFTATNNFTLNLPTNIAVGNSVTLIITQDSTGSRIMTANSGYKWLGGNKTLSTAPNSINIISIFYDGTNYLATLAAGYV